jgi:hypothetical protein
VLLSLCAKAQPFTNTVVFLENQKPGTTSWLLTNPTPSSGGIEGYASATSVARGEQINFLVNTTNSAYVLDVYRIGWYGGTGARQVFGPVVVPGTVQAIPAIQSNTLLVECAWTNPFTLTVTNNPDDPTDWASGAYVAKLTGLEDGYQSYIIFAVRDDERASDLLAQMSFSTYEAYNPWGGTSLYGTVVVPTAGKKVSFNRPFGRWQAPWLRQQWTGSGDFFASHDTGQAGWECNLVRWLEREGYDVSYCTSLDVHARTNLLLHHKAFISMGHDEYWSYPMRMNVQGARDQGVNLAFLAAGISFWQVRFEPSTVDGTPDRTMVCYRSTLLDPVASTSSNYLTTVQWRLPPVSLPEHLMVGVGVVTWALDADLVVSNPNHWLFANTGVQAGQRLIGLLGWEVDRADSLSPAGIQVACTSPFTDPWAPVGPTVSYSHAASYQAPSGATVFASGSFQWNWGVDDFNVPSLRSSRQSPLVQQMTRNVLARMLNNPTPSPTFFSRTELSTRGNWLPHYGIEGYLLPGALTNMPAFATLNDGGTPVISYLTNSLDTNALQQPGGGERFLAGWSSPTNFTIDLNLTDGQNHQVALYFWDWNNAGRTQTVDVVDAATTNLLDHRSLNGFTNGEWWVWQVDGHVQFQIGAVAGPDCLLNALMLGSGSQAGFVCVDAATQGNWQTNYGADGVFIAGHTPQPAPYATVSVTDSVTTNWSLGTLDIRAPVRGLGSNCIFGAWKASGFFANVLNLEVTDNLWHQLALYCVDSDRLGRQQVVSLVDPATHIVLGSRVLSDFGEGKYLVWNFRGPLEVHLLSLNRTPAVISALFLGVPDSAPVVALTAPSDGQSFALPTNIVLTATVSDPEDSVTQVSFYANSNLLASVTNAPFTWTWTNPPVAEYSLTAVALDNFNISATSAPVSISLTTGPDYQPPTIQVTFPPDGALMACPTNMLLSAVPNSGSAAVVSIQFFVDGTATGPLLTTDPFTLSSGNWHVGTHSICASVTDAFGVIAFSPTNVVTVSPVQASAVFRQFDFLPRGNWPGVYGSEGYSMAGIATQLPTFADVQPSQTNWIQWAAFVSDSRALLQPNSTLRFARTWYSFTNLVLDVNLLDGQTHRVSLYCLDWNNDKGAQLIYVSDAETAQVLDSRVLVGFSNGVYAVWDVTGHVQFSLTRDPSRLPAIVNGLFIDPPLTQPLVRLLSPTNGARFGQHDNIPFTALASSGAVPLSRVEFLVDDAIVGTNSTGPPYSLMWSNILPGQYTVAARAVDVLGSNTLSAPVLISVERPSSAGAMTLDPTHLGNWPGVYGRQGYVIAGDTTNFPPYGAANLDAQLVVWSTNTSEARALQSASGTNRVAAAWYSFTNLLVVDINFTDYAYHHLGLYFLDWPGFGAVQQVELLDNRTGAVLDSRTIGGFTNGVMCDWDVVGHLTVQIMALNGQPALLSGIFFDPSERAPTVNILAPADGDVFYVPTDIQIVAYAGPDPAVERLDFLAYGVPLGSSFQGPPYTLTWSNVPPGVYSLVASAICPLGNTNSAPVGITVIRRSVIAFTSFAPLGGGGLQLQGTGPPYTAFVLEAATNLDENASWMPLLTNPPGDGLFTFQFFDPTNYPQRFYRARVVP